MEYQEKYANMVERNSLCQTATGNGFRMLHDNFDPDWKRGDEPHGTLIFTDIPPLQSPPSRDLYAEIDEIKDRLHTLEVKAI